MDLKKSASSSSLNSTSSSDSVFLIDIFEDLYISRLFEEGNESKEYAKVENKDENGNLIELNLNYLMNDLYPVQQCILSHLNIKDLTILRLVSKDWNEMCIKRLREIGQKFREYYFECPCSITEFNSIFKEKPENVFGKALSLNPPIGSKLMKSPQVSLFLRLFGDKITKLFIPYYKKKFFKLITEKCGNQVTQIEMSIDTMNSLIPLDVNVNKLIFPSLKRFETHGSLISSQREYKFFKSLFKNSPNLQEVYFYDNDAEPITINTFLRKLYAKGLIKAPKLLEFYRSPPSNSGVWHFIHA